MNKIFFCLLTVSFFLMNYNAVSQPNKKPSNEDLVRALKGGRISIEADKLLLEPTEAASLNVKITVYPVQSGEPGDLPGQPSTYPLPDGSDPNVPAPYKPGTWKIVQGGGTLTPISVMSYSYTAPASAPKDKVMVISVDLLPNNKEWPKLVLLQTLYFADDNTAIVVNLPEAGFNNQKYTNQAKAGMVVPTMQGMDPRVAASLDPATKAKLAAAQAAVDAAQKEKGINLTAISSNAMAYYDAANDLTAVKLKGFTLQMENGRVPKNSSANEIKNILFEFSFKGKGIGNHTLNDKVAGAGFIVLPSAGCGCGNNGSGSGQKSDAFCDGYVVIKSIENNVMQGYIFTRVYTLDIQQRRLAGGFLHGRFTASIANL